jgi:homoserine O-succinyltransferase/O-acetyltransferase
MPIVMDGIRIPVLAGKNSRPAGVADGYDLPAECVEIALINNMPDAALEDTESQFFDLLDIASGDIPVRVKLYSLPNVPRSDRGHQHLRSFYFGIEDLLNSRFDGVIMTGTEPRQPNLRDEPYWPALASVLDWAEDNTCSTVLSCLAAHAGVLHCDGIPRCPLGDKQFGVFEYKKTADHLLTRNGQDLVRFPHSRCNEVQMDALTSCGYTVLTQSPEAGVDTFVKKKKRSLFVHFQGHPEYGEQTLLKEYRRDIKRFLRQERNTYPSMPKGYFDAAAAKLLTDFRELVLRDRREELIADFPETAVAGTLQNNWRSSATAIYRNWLQYLVSKKADASSISVMTTVFEIVQRKRSVLM